MASETLHCWKCGTALAGLPLPIGRRENCPHCIASLHACRLCAFFDVAANKQCREPVADEVTDKEAANFCDYFRASAGRGPGTDPEAAGARAKLDALFGSTGAPRGPRPAPRSDDPAEAARRRLAERFGPSKE